MPEQTERACCSSSISLQHSTGGDGGMKGVEERRGERAEREDGYQVCFFHLDFNWPLAAFTRVKCSFCGGHQVQWTLSTISME